MHVLRLLRLLGHRDSDASESMNDLLAQVCESFGALRMFDVLEWVYNHLLGFLLLKKDGL